jgi:hypothetical protein
VGFNRGLNRFSGPPLPAGLPWRDRIHPAGTLSARPPAGPWNAGLLYLATDVAGGTLYRSTGTAWAQVAAGVIIPPGVTSLTLTQPASGITLTNSGVTQTGAAASVVALANDLAALEALGGTNTIYYRSGADTWTAVTIGANLTFSGGSLAATGGGSGSVTNVSSNNLSTLFSVSIATPTTTPAFTFTFFPQSPNQVFAGPSSGVLGGAPTWRAIVTADLPDNVTTYAKIQDVTATSRVLGRKTAGAGDAEELALSDVLDFIGSAAQGDVLYRGASAWQRLALGAASTFLGSDGTNPLWSLASMQVALLRDEKTQNTDGGTFTSGAWRTRTLNVEKFDVGANVSLASNQMTLSAGTYWVFAVAPVYAVDRHQLRLQNVTDTVTLVIGGCEFATGTAGGGNHAWLFGRFTIAASKALELQHQCQTTSATFGLGPACNFTTEIYAQVWLFRES